MVEDATYVIVPNKTTLQTDREYDAPAYSSNESGNHVVQLLMAGFRVDTKLATHDAVHYILIRDTPRPDARRAGDEARPSVTAISTNNNAPF